jgi:hypothetical protein
MSRDRERQVAFRDAVNSAGGLATLAVGLDAALGQLEQWSPLQRTMT